MLSRTLKATLMLVSVAAAALSGCGLGTVSRGEGGPRPRPNIIMILADDMGYSDLGAMGSEIATPNLDALAASGRLLTNYHTGASCSPTRSMLLSGTDHHQAGLGAMAENIGIALGQNRAPWGKDQQFTTASLPAGYEGYLNDQVQSLPQTLKAAGYHTYMVGKWHIGFAAADPENNQGQVIKPRPASFPRAKGFERSFALLQGAAAHFAPVPGKPTVGDLAAGYVEDDERVGLPRNFYSSTSFTDKLMYYIDADRDDGKPFFAYLAFSAPHWPLQAPDEDIARVKGRYDEGYEVIRARRIEKMKAMGLVPKDFQANPGLDTTLGRPRWVDLSGDKRAVEARKMEIYAAMVENMDRNIGRLVQHLKDTGRYDNTMIVFATDNGAEGSHNFFPDNANTDNSLENLGRLRSNVAYGERWAEVSATPFKLWKGWQSEGGVSSPLVVRMPGQTRGLPLSNELVHVTDLAPTFLALAGVGKTTEKVLPMTGLSMLPLLQGQQKQGPRGASDVLAGELFTSRYVIRGDWKLVSIPTPFGDGQWQLFNMRQDRGETTNLSASHPELVSQLSQAYETYAARMGVQTLMGGKQRAPAP